MKNTFSVIFISLLLISGCGQTGPLVLPETLPDAKTSVQQELKPDTKQTTDKPKKSS
jgi:predicted small lipoprotein YifL